MKDWITKILIDMEFAKSYEELCLCYSNFDERVNIKRKDIEMYIRSRDPDFKYISKDRIFLKEMPYKEYTTRFFLGFKGGIIDFSYLIWKEGENQKYYKGRLASLARLVNCQFNQNVQYATPIATSIEDCEHILDEIFSLFEVFVRRFQQEESNKLS